MRTSESTLNILVVGSMTWALFSSGCSAPDDRSYPRPMAELCNGEDDDLDEIIDDDATCPTVYNALRAACIEGACRVTTCVAPFLDCDASAVNGCEINSRFDAQGCGACTPCGSGAACLEGECVPIGGTLLGGAGNQAASNITSVTDGDLVVSGVYGGGLTLDGETLTEGNRQQTFIVRLSTEGEHRWHTTLRDTTTVNVSPVVNTRGLAAADDGSVYVVGEFRESLNCGAETLNVIENQVGWSFFAKLDPDGTCAFVRVPTTPVANPAFVWAGSVAATPSGPIVAGTFLKGFSSIYETTGYLSAFSTTGMPLAQVSLGAAFPGRLLRHGTDVLAAGHTTSTIEHAGTVFTVPSDDALYAAPFTSALVAVEPLVARNPSAGSNWLTDVVSLDADSFAWMHGTANESVIEAFDGATMRFRLALPVPSGAKLLASGNRLYAFFPVDGAARKVGSYDLPSAGESSLLVLTIDASNGSILWAGRMALGSFGLVDALISEGTLWLVGSTKDPIDGITTTPIAEDAAILSLPLTAFE